MPTRERRGWQPLPVPGRPQVSLAVAAYHEPDALGCLLFSLKAQTYDRWEAVIVHDGPGPEVRELVAGLRDDRIRLLETPERRGQYGHPWRRLGIDACTGAYIGLSNADNYYAPVYFEWMLAALIEQRADFAYCNMVHSYSRYSPVASRPGKGGLDLGAWVARAELVKATPWWDMGFMGDGTFIEDLLDRTAKVVHVPGFLFVHN
jgi:glycosyltransferase involved in cell wall biosynthesis